MKYKIYCNINNGKPEIIGQIGWDGKNYIIAGIDKDWQDFLDEWYKDALEDSHVKHMLKNVKNPLMYLDILASAYRGSYFWLSNPIESENFLVEHKYVSRK